MRPLLLPLCAAVLIPAMVVAWAWTRPTPIPVLPAAAPDAARLDRAVAELDGLVSAHWAAQGVVPGPVVEDATFLRRISLDLIGRIPTAAEAAAFQTDRDPGKRAALIRRLIASPGHDSHAFNRWADLLRIKTRARQPGDGTPYVAWIKDAIAQSKAYDVMVRELLTAEGSLWAPGGGATGYYLRDAGMPEDNLAATMQCFLGTSIACAQCHDHPYDHWTRQDFLRLSAYTASTRTGPVDRSRLRDLQRELNALDADDRTEQRLRQLVRNLHQGVSGGKEGVRKVPHDYQYDDLKPGQQISAKPLFGAQAPVRAGEDPRQVFAAWLTGPDNPRFARVAVNREWKRLLGVGLFEPIDDLKDDTVVAAEPVLAFLARFFQEGGYDLRDVEELICRSDLYQRVALAAGPQPGEAWHLPGPVLRRLSAEQIWDSALTLVVPDLDQRTQPMQHPFAGRYAELSKASAAELLAMVEEEQKGQRARTALMAEGKKLREQAAMAKTPAERAALRQRLQELQVKRTELEGMGGGESGKDKVRQRPGGRGQALPPGFVRASELPAPAPEGHFLRQFGQSDRELIDNGNRAPSVPQALTLMNAWADGDLLHPQGVLAQGLRSAASDQARRELVFLSMLGRQPTAAECDLVANLGAGAEPKAWTDLVWVLINSHEFLFQH